MSHTRYYIDDLKSFSLGAPNIVDAWKEAIKEFENNDFVVVAFKLPVREKAALIEMIERMINDKMK